MSLKGTARISLGAQREPVRQHLAGALDDELVGHRAQQHHPVRGRGVQRADHQRQRIVGPDC